jgi:multidrug efflux pump subunit AcrA (membrane-fusion protein)
MRKGASFAGLATAAQLCMAFLAGCNDDTGSQAPLARIDAVTAKVVDFAPRVSLTGTIQAQVQNDLSFRLSGRIIERIM